MDYATWKDRKLLAAAVRPIYTAPSAEAAQAELDAFEAGPWGKRFPTVVVAWRRAWSHVIPFFAFPVHIRRSPSVPELVAAIDQYIAHHNTNPKPFIWTKSARDILQ